MSGIDHRFMLTRAFAKIRLGCPLHVSPRPREDARVHRLLQATGRLRDCERQECAGTRLGHLPRHGQVAHGPIHEPSVARRVGAVEVDPLRHRGPGLDVDPLHLVVADAADGTIVDCAPPERLDVLQRDKDECRRALGDRFAAVEELVEGADALPPSVHRGPVYFALALGAHTFGGHELLDPGWTRRRDEAYAELDDAIRKLKVVLSRRRLESETEGLERELRRLVRGEGEPPLPVPGPVDWRENTRRKLLRIGLRWEASGGGRPRAVWRHETFKLLRREGVTVEKTEALLEAAGLTGTSPTQADAPRLKRRPQKPKA